MASGVVAPRWSALAYGDEEAVLRVLDGVRAARTSAAQQVGVEVVNEPGKVVIGASDGAIFQRAVDALAENGIPTGAFQLQPPTRSPAVVLLRAAVVAATLAAIYLFGITGHGRAYLDRHPALRDMYAHRGGRGGWGGWAAGAGRAAEGAWAHTDEGRRGGRRLSELAFDVPALAWLVWMAVLALGILRLAYYYVYLPRWHGRPSNGPKPHES